MRGRVPQSTPEANPTPEEISRGLCPPSTPEAKPTPQEMSRGLSLGIEEIILLSNTKCMFWLELGVLLPNPNLLQPRSIFVRQAHTLYPSPLMMNCLLSPSTLLIIMQYRCPSPYNPLPN